MSYFPPYGNSNNKIEVKLDFSNYEKFAEKDGFANLKLEVDKLDID